MITIQNRPPRPHAACSNPACGKLHGAARTRCEACYSYWKRHHQERPAAWCHRAPRLPKAPRAVARPVRVPRRVGSGICANLECTEAPVGGATRCRACYMYRYRHGAERPARLTRPQDFGQCANPACDMPRGGGWVRCCACAVYRWRNGVERPARLAAPSRVAS